MRTLKYFAILGLGVALSFQACSPAGGNSTGHEYMPDMGRPIRITSLQSVTGSIFNNADILRIDYSAEYKVETAR